VGAQPIDHTPMLPYPFCHNTTLQHYRPLSVTWGSGERISENSVYTNLAALIFRVLR
jgi:hypothetical protein